MLNLLTWLSHTRSTLTSTSPFLSIVSSSPYHSTFMASISRPSLALTTALPSSVSYVTSIITYPSSLTWPPSPLLTGPAPLLTAILPLMFSPLPSIVTTIVSHTNCLALGSSHITSCETSTSPSMTPTSHTSSPAKLHFNISLASPTTPPHHPPILSDSLGLLV
jgi:hypothetical protein